MNTNRRKIETYIEDERQKKKIISIEIKMITEKEKKKSRGGDNNHNTNSRSGGSSSNNNNSNNINSNNDLSMQHLSRYSRVAPNGADFCHVKWRQTCLLLRRGVFGHGLRAFWDRVFCQFAWQEETDSGLNLATGNGGTLVVVS